MARSNTPAAYFHPIHMDASALDYERNQPLPLTAGQIHEAQVVCFDEEDCLYRWFAIVCIDNKEYPAISYGTKRNPPKRWWLAKSQLQAMKGGAQ